MRYGYLLGPYRGLPHDHHATTLYTSERSSDKCVPPFTACLPSKATFLNRPHRLHQSLRTAAGHRDGQRSRDPLPAPERSGQVPAVRLERAGVHRAVSHRGALQSTHPRVSQPHWRCCHHRCDHCCDHRRSFHGIYNHNNDGDGSAQSPGAV